MYAGKSYRLPLSDLDLLGWTSPDESVVSIDGKMITGKAAGDAVLTVSLPGDKQLDLKIRATE